MRASAFKCTPVEFSGATSTKNRCVGRPSIESKSTPSGARPTHGDQLADGVELAVRNRHALADRRRRQPLALEQHLGQHLAIDLLRPRHVGREVVRQLSNHRALLVRLQLRHDELGSDEVYDLHSLSLWRRTSCPLRLARAAFAAGLDEPVRPVAATIHHIDLV